MKGLDWVLLLVSALLGPVVANLVFLFGTAIVAGQLNAETLSLLLPSLPIAFVIALLPAAIAGVCNVLIGKIPAASLNLRLLLSLPVGAVVFVVALNGLAQDESGAFSMPDLAALGLAGALASLLPVLITEAASRRPD